MIPGYCSTIDSNCWVGRIYSGRLLSVPLVWVFGADILNGNWRNNLQNRTDVGNKWGPRSGRKWIWTAVRQLHCHRCWLHLVANAMLEDMAGATLHLCPQALKQTTKVINWPQIFRKRSRMQFFDFVFHIICQTEKALFALNDYGHINLQQHRLLILSPACQKNFESSISETVHSFSIVAFNQSVDRLARRAWWRAVSSEQDIKPKQTVSRFN